MRALIELILTILKSFSEKPVVIPPKPEAPKMLKFKKNSNIQLSENFNSNEFDCKCNGLCEETILSEELVSNLQLIRSTYGRPIKISSGYRCPAHNKNVGGVENSTHTQGIACDLQTKDLTALSLVIKQLFPKCSIGRYNTFIHFDIRQDSRYWDRRSN